MLSFIWPAGIATLFGAGLSKKAPGTVGSIVAMPVVFLFSLFSDVPYLISTFLVIIIGIIASEAYGKGEDNQEIVIDEFAGIMVTFFLIPHHWFLWILGFLLFRFFDILKPFPISYLDKNVKGGIGVMADDILAGVFANAVIHYVWLPYIHKLVFS